MEENPSGGKSRRVRGKNTKDKLLGPTLPVLGKKVFELRIRVRLSTSRVAALAPEARTRACPLPATRNGSCCSQLSCSGT